MKKFKKPCKRCEKFFLPNGKFQQICNNCNKIFKKQKTTCPYLENKKFCTHKTSNNNIKFRPRCQYKNPIKCELFLKWQELTEKSE